MAKGARDEEQFALIQFARGWTLASVEHLHAADTGVHHE
jgi:hypothetical protein